MSRLTRADKSTVDKPEAVDAINARGRRVGIPSVIRRWVLARDGGRCRKRASPDDLELHHVKEVIYGGRHDPDNLDTLCQRCHAIWTHAQPALISYSEWLAVPPLDALESLIAIAHRSSPEGIAAVLELARPAVELVAQLQACVARRRVEHG